MANTKKEEKKEVKPWKIYSMKSEILELLVKHMIKEFEDINRGGGRLVTIDDVFTCKDSYKAFMFQCSKTKNIMSTVIALGILELLDEMKSIKTLLAEKEVEIKKPATGKSK